MSIFGKSKRERVLEKRVGDLTKALERAVSEKVSTEDGLLLTYNDATALLAQMREEIERLNAEVQALKTENERLVLMHKLPGPQRPRYKKS